MTVEAGTDSPFPTCEIGGDAAVSSSGESGPLLPESEEASAVQTDGRARLDQRICDWLLHVWHGVSRPPWGAIVLITCVAFITHGLLLISDFCIWDGWRQEFWLTHGDWELVRRHLGEAGMPALIYFRRALSPFRNVNLAYKVFSFCCIACSGLFTFSLLRQIRCLSRAEALITTLFSLTFPAFRVAGEVSVAQYLFCYALFLGTALWSIWARKRSWGIRLTARVGALLGFSVSFYTGSLLTFYFGFITVIVLLDVGKPRSDLAWCRQLLGWSVRHVDFLVLPFAFWGLKGALSPAHGFCAGYNAPQLTIERLATGVESLILRALGPSLLNGLLPFGATRWALLLTPILFIALVALLRSIKPEIFPQKRSSGVGVLVFGAFLLFLGTFPYIAVGAVSGSYGWETRTALLHGLPVALILLGLFRLVFAEATPSDLRLCLPLLVLLITGFISSYLRTYVSWQALAARDRSILHNFSSLPEREQYSVLEIRNGFTVPRTVEYYGITHWTYMLAHSLGKASCLAFETRPGASLTFGGPPRGDAAYTKEELEAMLISTTIPYALTDVDVNGKQGILSIRRGEGYLSSSQLAVEYWFYRLFRREKLGAFFQRISVTELKPRQS